MFEVEAYFYPEHSLTVSGAVYQYIQAICSGAAGFSMGSVPIWGFGEPTFCGDIGPAAALAGYLDTADVVATYHWATFLQARQWWKLAPSTGSALVTTALGSGATATVPALASDGSFALIGKGNASSITVQKSALAATFNARWFDPTAGTFTTPGEGLSHSNSGTQAFAHPGNDSAGGTAWVLVLET
jgi:hypothetical protein